MQSLKLKRVEHSTDSGFALPTTERNLRVIGHAGKQGICGSGGARGDSHVCQAKAVRDKAPALKRNPLSSVRRRLVGEPAQILCVFIDGNDGAPNPGTVIDGCGSVLTRFLRARGDVEGEPNCLVLGERKGLERAEDPVFEDGLKLLRHAPSIVVLPIWQRPALSR